MYRRNLLQLLSSSPILASVLQTNSSAELIDIPVEYLDRLFNKEYDTEVISVDKGVLYTADKTVNEYTLQYRCFEDRDIVNFNFYNPDDFDDDIEVDGIIKSSDVIYTQIYPDSHFQAWRLMEIARIKDPVLALRYREENQLEL